MPPSLERSNVVLCDAYFLPVQEVSVEEAVSLLFTGKAEPLYGVEGLQVVARLGIAPSACENWGKKFPELISGNHFLVPAGIRLRRALPYRLHLPGPARPLIFRRDGHACQYCGARGGLTLDHVMPRSRGGGHTWENLVAACGPCNQRKGDRTPEEAGMKLNRAPRRFSPNVFMETMARLTGCPA